MVTKKFFNRAIHIFDRARGSLSKKVSIKDRHKNMERFSYILYHDFNMEFHIFHKNVLKNNRYFSKEMVETAQKFLRKNIKIIGEYYDHKKTC